MEVKASKDRQKEAQKDKRTKRTRRRQIKAGGGTGGQLTKKSRMQQA